MLRPIEPVVHYYLNQDYIAAHFCINKNKPKMHCNGKCYLMRQLRKQNQPEKNGKAISIQLENYPIGFVTFVKLPIKPIAEELLTQHYFYTNNYTYLTASIPFHPPKFV